MKFYFDELTSKETVEKGKFGDLKISTPKTRVWLDVKKQRATVEVMKDGEWKKYFDYVPELRPHMM